MASKLLWGWDATNKVWVPLSVDANGCLKVDMSNINLDDLADVSVATPADDDLFYYDDATSLWKSRKLVDADIPAGIARDAEVTAAVATHAALPTVHQDAPALIAVHAALITGTHGLGAYGFADATLAAITLYVDAGAGNDGNPGTSASPKATKKGALDVLPVVIAHECTIYVRGPQNYAENNTYLDLARFDTLAFINFKVVNSSDEDMYDNGLATSGGNDTLNDTGKAWSADQFNGAYIWIYEGTGKGQIREILDTTATQIQTTANWATNPDGTSYYVIGGGATLTGTDSYHLLNQGKKCRMYGFRHTGATSRDVACWAFGNQEEYNAYHASSVNGIQFSSQSAGWERYCYSSAITRGIWIVGMCIPYVRSNVFDGATRGVHSTRGSIAVMLHTAGNLNYIANCTTGIDIEGGSGCVSASVQAFGAGADANITDISPVPSTTVPEWYT